MSVNLDSWECCYADKYILVDGEDDLKLNQFTSTDRTIFGATIYNYKGLDFQVAIFNYWF